MALATRIRQKPHVAGDWPVHVYLDLSKIAPKIDKVRQRLRAAIQLENNESHLFESLSRYHVSLSKQLYLKHY